MPTVIGIFKSYLVLMTFHGFNAKAAFCLKNVKSFFFKKKVYRFFGIEILLNFQEI